MVSRLVLYFLAALATANPIHPGGEDCQDRRHVGGVGNLARAILSPPQLRNAPIEGSSRVEIRYASAGGSDDSGSVGSKAEKSKDKSQDKKKEKETGSGNGFGSGGSCGSGSSSSANNGTAPGGGGSYSGSGSSGGLQKTFPTPAGTENLSEARTITGSFDGGMKLFDRVPSTCTGGEGGQKDAAFILEDGATLSNVIIGGGAGEGIQCQGSCNLVNVWWDKVCEDGATFRQTGGTSTVRGGGARDAPDKLFQHNGGGTLEVSDFYGVNIGQFWRSCGNCEEQTARAAVFTNIRVDGGKTVAHYNGNLGDKVAINGACVLGGAEVCKNSEGVAGGREPGDAPNDPALCVETNVKTSGC